MLIINIVKIKNGTPSISLISNLCSFSSPLPLNILLSIPSSITNINATVHINVNNDIINVLINSIHILYYFKYLYIITLTISTTYATILP